MDQKGGNQAKPYHGPEQWGPKGRYYISRNLAELVITLLYYIILCVVINTLIVLFYLLI